MIPHSTAQHSTAQPETRLNSTAKSRKPKVVITSLGRVNYFEWFLLGLYQLQEAGEISLGFDMPLMNRLLFSIPVRGINKLRKIFIPDSYNMDGYILFEDGSRKTFSVDSADAPYLFDEEKLNTCDAYFKVNCPSILDEDSFALTDSIRIPWSDHKHVDNSLKRLTDRGERCFIADLGQYIRKIFPLMQGPRSLSRGMSYALLKGGYSNYLQGRNLRKSKKFMCYFGNAQGPAPEKNVTHPDYDWERDIMGYYAEQVSHPNEKRARIAEYLSGIGAEADARIISTSNADSGIRTNAELIVPLKDFCRYISSFQYNFNVSGYRMSIPSRFIESFMVGTAIVTDKLVVRWYLPFDECEVFETVKMGYERMEDVDWAQFERDVMSLPETDPAKIVDCFNRKWAPEVVARYIIDTVRQAGETA